MTTLPELSRRVSEAEGPSRELDESVAKALGWLPSDAVWWIKPDGGQNMGTPEWTRSLDAVAALIAEKLPGWMWRAQTCGLSAEAWVAPDLNDANCEADIRADEARWHDYAERNEIEIRPGSNGALVSALLSAALLAIHERNKSDDNV